MDEMAEKPTSTDTLKNASQDSAIKLFVVKGTVLSSNIDELTSADIVEIETNVTEPVKLVKEHIKKETTKIAKQPKHKQIKDQVTVKPKSNKKEIWLPYSSTQLSNFFVATSFATVPDVDYAKALIVTTSFAKPIQLISFKETTEVVVYDELFFETDFSTLTKLRPPPTNNNYKI